MVFQNPDNQIIGNVVEEDVGFGPENMGVPTEEIWARVDKSLEAVGMTAYRLQSPNKLSGGQKQRLAIARSLCVNPEILLLDEPCSALDMKNTIAIEETLLELKGKYTFVIVTHNLAQAKRIADQIIFMDQGRVLEVTDTKTFFEHPSSEPAREQIQYM